MAQHLPCSGLQHMHLSPSLAALWQPAPRGAHTGLIHSPQQSPTQLWSSAPKQRSIHSRAQQGRQSPQVCRAAAAVQDKPASFQVVGETQEVPAYKGRAVEVKKGQFIKVINTPGTQVVDFFAMNIDTAKDGYLREVMSMHHSRDNTGKIIPVPGDVMVTSKRQPILTIMEDTGPGIHDTLVAACDHHLYEKMLGISPEDPHDSCTNNLHTSLAAIGWKLTDDPDTYLTPGPFNLWMNVPFSASGQLTDWWAPPAEGQKPGDFVIMRAEMNCVCVMSACPSDDICGINGPEGTKSVHFEVLESA